MTTIGSPAGPLGRLEGLARGGGEGEGRCRLSSPPPKGATPCDRPPRGALLIPRPLRMVDYFTNDMEGTNLVGHVAENRGNRHGVQRLAVGRDRLQNEAAGLLGRVKAAEEGLDVLGGWGTAQAV